MDSAGKRSVGEMDGEMVRGGLSRWWRIHDGLRGGLLGLRRDGDDELTAAAVAWGRCCWSWCEVAAPCTPAWPLSCSADGFIFFNA